MIARPTSQSVWGWGKTQFLLCLKQASVIGCWGWGAGPWLSLSVSGILCHMQCLIMAAGLAATAELELSVNVYNHYLIIVLSNLDFDVS